MDINAQNIKQENKLKSNIISQELHEKTRKDGLKKLEEPDILAVFMRLKDK